MKDPASLCAPPAGSMKDPPSDPKNIAKNSLSMSASVGIDADALIGAEEHREEQSQHVSLLQPSGSTQLPLSAPNTST